MKCHIGVDAGTGYVHTVTATSANVHDITETHNLLREDDEVVYGDSGYIGIEKREEIKTDENLSKMNKVIGKQRSPLVVRTRHFHCCNPVQSLVWELRSYIKPLHTAAKRKRKTSISFFSPSI